MDDSNYGAYPSVPLNPRPTTPTEAPAEMGTEQQQSHAHECGIGTPHYTCLCECGHTWPNAGPLPKLTCVASVGSGLNAPAGATPRESASATVPPTDTQLAALIAEARRLIEQLPIEAPDLDAVIHQLSSLLQSLSDALVAARLRAERDSERTVGAVGRAITSAEGDMLWTDHAVNEIVANATTAQRRAADQWQLGSNTPWPLRDVLQQLVGGCRHLLQDHNCDRHGWENLHAAVEAATTMLVESLQSSSQPPTDAARRGGAEEQSPHPDSVRLDWLDRCDLRSLTSLIGMVGDGNDVRGQIDAAIRETVPDTTNNRGQD